MRTRGPGIVIGPIVDRIGAILAIQESDRDKRGYKCTVIADPVNSELDVLCRHVTELSIGTVRRGPQN